MVVLDIMMPEMDGYEVCRRIRATSQVPVLFLTAKDTDISQVAGFAVGADDYVTKPFKPPWSGGAHQGSFETRAWPCWS